MYVRYFLPLFLVFCVAGCSVFGARATGRSGSREDLAQLLKARSSDASNNSTVVPAKAVHYTVDGRDSETSRSLALNDGLVIFHVNYQGSDDVSVVLLDDNGDVVDDVADGHDTFVGSTAIGLDQSCQCAIDVQTTGTWTITVDQPQSLTGTALPTTLSGVGQAASTAFQSDGGLTRFHLVMRDPTGARVTLLRANGEVLDLLGEDTRGFERSRTVELDPGAYLLQVDTDAAWTVDVAPAR
jgi:hypothetical protein